MNRRKFLSSAAMAVGAAAVPSIPFSEPAAEVFNPSPWHMAWDHGAGDYCTWILTRFHEGQIYSQPIRLGEVYEMPAGTVIKDVRPAAIIGEHADMVVIDDVA